MTAFVRRKEAGEALVKSGAAGYILGDLADANKIAQAVTENDIIIHAATADDLPSVQAVLKGIRQRAEQGKSTIYIHTSGSAILDDGAKGEYKSDKIYHDDVRSEIDSIPDSAPHRSIDLAILQAQQELGDRAKIALMIPPMIYGFVSAHSRLSIQEPALIRFALKHKFVPVVGEGKSVWSTVHVADLGRAYLTLLHHLERADASETLDNPYFFCEASGDEEPSWMDVSVAIGEALKAQGKIDDVQPKPIQEKDFGDLLGQFTPMVVGCNSRSRANRLRSLGWVLREKSWKESLVEDEIPQILRE